jgi:hypothetical protein
LPQTAASELGAEDDNWAWKKIMELETLLLSVFEARRADRVGPHAAARKMADERVARLNEFSVH